MTPHPIMLNDGRTFQSEGIARVSAVFSNIENDCCTQSFGEVVGLPEPEEGTMYIVSALVFGATDRKDVVAPATGHPLCVRNDKGQIISVPCFIKK